MATLAEMTAWSIEETRAEVDRLLPPGWAYRQSHVGFFRGVICDADGVAQWDESHADERLLLLDAYGWLWTRSLSAPIQGLWATRRTELTSRTVGQHAARVPDPEDLDPAELAMVYPVGSPEGGSDDD